MKITRCVLVMALVLTGTVAVARAQEAQDADGPENDPEHGVARISVMAGDVSTFTR